MNWIRGAGDYGPLILAATAGLGVASLVAAWRRASRGIAIALLVVSLMPAAVGVVGMFEFAVRSTRDVETLRAPTPKDLAVDVYAGQCCMLLGMAGSALALVAAAAVYTRSPRPEEPPSLSG